MNYLLAVLLSMAVGEYSPTHTYQLGESVAINNHYQAHPYSLQSYEISATSKYCEVSWSYSPDQYNTILGAGKVVKVEDDKVWIRFTFDHCQNESEVVVDYAFKKEQLEK